LYNNKEKTKLLVIYFYGREYEILLLYKFTTISGMQHWTRLCYAKQKRLQKCLP